MQQITNDQNPTLCQLRRIQFFFLFLLLIFVQPTFLCAADFTSKLKGITITDQTGKNKPPTAVITYTQDGSTFTFDGGGSSDSDGSIAQYKWNFGDGGTATTAVTQHQFLTPGEAANVSLNTIDDKGAAALSQVFFVVPVIYEDAEDDTLGRWSIYGDIPPGVVITNVFDEERQSRVINFSGTGNNGFSLRKENGIAWNNTKNFVIQWSFKYSLDYTIYVDCKTSSGHRWLKYTFADINKLGTGESVEHGLGLSTKDGKWHTIIRNLQVDLNDAQPGATILSVDGVNIRGAGRWDDIMLK